MSEAFLYAQVSTVFVIAAAIGSFCSSVIAEKFGRYVVLLLPLKLHFNAFKGGRVRVFMSCHCSVG